MEEGWKKGIQEQTVVPGDEEGNIKGGERKFKGCGTRELEERKKKKKMVIEEERGNWR